MPKMWWLNQGESSKWGDDALATVWAPKADKLGHRRDHWDRMLEVRKGDQVVHVADKMIRAFSTVIAPAYDCPRPWAERDGWEEDGRALPVDLVELPIPVPVSEIPEAERLRAGAGPFTVNGGGKTGYLFPVDDSLSERISGLLELDVLGINELSDPAWGFNGPTDRERMALYRAEQPQLRRLALAGRSEAECDLCGDVFPQRFLVAAHIKKRSTATDRERRDPHNVMLACAFGCDIAFELGVLRVDSNGRAYVLRNAPASIQSRLASVEGRAIAAYNAASRGYFAARESSFLQ